MRIFTVRIGDKYVAFTITAVGAAVECTGTSREEAMGRLLRAIVPVSNVAAPTPITGIFDIYGKDTN